MGRKMERRPDFAAGRRGAGRFGVAELASAGIAARIRRVEECHANGKDAGSAAEGARRDRSIRLAVLTSFLSKGGTVLLQLLAIPLAVRVMGRAEFGVYTSVSLALSTVALLEVGVGPALAHGLAGSGADPGRRRRLASSAFFLMLGVAAVTGLALAAVLWTVPVPTLFGADYRGMEAVMRPALWVGLGLFLMLFLLNLTDRLREGLLEVAQTNLWGAAGNVLAAAAVAAGVWFVPEVWFLVLAIHGSVVLAKLGNTAAVWRRHRDLIPSWRLVDAGTIRHLLGDGAAFATACLLVGVVEFNFCAWLIGRMAGPSEVALYGVLVSLTVMQLGFVIMLSTPTWPAVAEALGRGDLAWARKSARRLYGFGLGFAACAAAGLVGLGPWVLELWLGDDFAGVGRGVLAAYALYFVAHVWRHLNHALMIGSGQVMRLARAQFFETAVLAGAVSLVLRGGGLEMMLVTMAGVILAVTGWVLPVRVRRRLRG